MHRCPCNNRRHVAALSRWRGPHYCVTARAIMNVFDLRNRLVADYQSYTRSFIKIRDARIDEYVSQALGLGAFWPEPLLQLNPTFQSGGTVDDLVAHGTLR